MLPPCIDLIFPPSNFEEPAPAPAPMSLTPVGNPDMQYKFNYYIQVRVNFISISNIVVRALLSRGIIKNLQTAARTRTHTYIHAHR